jgi:hypothetical protein
VALKREVRIVGGVAEVKECVCGGVGLAGRLEVGLVDGRWCGIEAGSFATLRMTGIRRGRSVGRNSVRGCAMGMAHVCARYFLRRMHWARFSLMLFVCALSWDSMAAARRRTVC